MTHFIVLQVSITHLTFTDCTSLYSQSDGVSTSGSNKQWSQECNHAPVIQYKCTVLHNCFAHTYTVPMNVCGVHVQSVAVRGAEMVEVEIVCNSVPQLPYNIICNKRQQNLFKILLPFVTDSVCGVCMGPEWAPQKNVAGFFLCTPLYIASHFFF